MLNLKIATCLGIANKYNNRFRWFLQLRKRLKILLRNEPKIFVIGLNKTGTTSVFAAINELGIDMSNQHDAERIYLDILDQKKTNKDILSYCRYHEGFQDIPFSIPEYYKLIDKEFNNSKFILTVRNSDEEWYRSFKKYYKVKEDLKENEYISKGFLYRVFQKIFKTNKFEEEVCRNVYSEHYADVLKYFENKKHKLLVINVSKNGAYLELCQFLGKKPLRKTFEWRNKTVVINKT